MQDILAADDDPDGLIIDFDRVDYREDVAFSSIGIAIIKFLAHQAHKGIDPLSIDCRDCATLGALAAEVLRPHD